MSHPTRSAKRLFSAALQKTPAEVDEAVRAHGVSSLPETREVSVTCSDQVAGLIRDSSITSMDRFIRLQRRHSASPPLSSSFITVCPPPPPPPPPPAPYSMSCEDSRCRIVDELPPGVVVSSAPLVAGMYLERRPTEGTGEDKR